MSEFVKLSMMIVRESYTYPRISDEGSTVFQKLLSNKRFDPATFPIVDALRMGG